MLSGMATSASDLLDYVNDAIIKVTSGCEEYYVGSRRVRYPPLTTLQAMRNDLIKQINAESAGGMTLQIGVRIPAS